MSIILIDALFSSDISASCWAITAASKSFFLDLDLFKTGAIGSVWGGKLSLSSLSTYDCLKVSIGLGSNIGF